MLCLSAPPGIMPLAYRVVATDERAPSTCSTSCFWSIDCRNAMRASVFVKNGLLGFTVTSADWRVGRK